MGSGEYGGNGSVHWNIENKHDKQNGSVKKKYHGEDGYPAAGGNFVVQVLNIPEGSWTFAATDTSTTPPTGTLLVPLPIKHGQNFTRQILVTWPDPPTEAALPMKGTGKSSAARKQTYKAKARKK